jgi:hypothetical protein
VGGTGSQSDGGQRGSDLGFWYRLVRFDNTNLLLEFARLATTNLFTYMLTYLHTYIHAYLFNHYVCPHTIHTEIHTNKHTHRLIMSVYIYIHTYIHTYIRTGLPGMSEQHIDGKKDLDIVLKNACFALKQSAIKMLLGTCTYTYIHTYIHTYIPYPLKYTYIHTYIPGWILTH